MTLVGKELISHVSFSTADFFFFFFFFFFLQNQLFRKILSRVPPGCQKGLDPDQSRRNVGPDLAPSCLQRLSADYTSRQRVTGDGIYKLDNFSCFFFVY